MVYLSLQRDKHILPLNPTRVRQTMAQINLRPLPTPPYNRCQLLRGPPPFTIANQTLPHTASPPPPASVPLTTTTEMPEVKMRDIDHVQDHTSGYWNLPTSQKSEILFKLGVTRASYFALFGRELRIQEELVSIQNQIEFATNNETCRPHIPGLELRRGMMFVELGQLHAEIQPFEAEMNRLCQFVRAPHRNEGNSENKDVHVSPYTDSPDLFSATSQASSQTASDRSNAK